jgi:hypothetical protein
LLSDANDEVRHQAAGLLMGISSSNDINRDAVRDANGIVPLVQLLVDANTMVRQKAAGSLLVLACNSPRNQEVIREAGGIVAQCNY